MWDFKYLTAQNCTWDLKNCHLMVILFQVWFREGIHPRIPEGTRWDEVEVPKEVVQLSLGPKDLLWAVLWDGNLLVRTGLSLDSPTGQPSPPCDLFLYFF